MAAGITFPFLSKEQWIGSVEYKRTLSKFIEIFY
jgi:hypothetical protein